MRPKKPQAPVSRPEVEVLGMHAVLARLSHIRQMSEALGARTEAVQATLDAVVADLYTLEQAIEMNFYVLASLQYEGITQRNASLSAYMARVTALQEEYMAATSVGQFLAAMGDVED